MTKIIIHQLSLTGIGGVQQSFVPYFQKALKDSEYKHLVYGMHELDENYNDISEYYTNINKSIWNKLKFIYFLYSSKYIVHFYNNLASKKVYRLLKYIPSNSIIFHERGASWNAKDEDKIIFQNNTSKATIVLANSNASKIMLVKRFGIDEKKIQVIYNGFLSKDNEYDPNDTKRYSEKFSIGYIGRLDTPKGVHVLIKSATKLKQYDFFIAGDGVWKDMLMDQAKGYENIKFVGRVKEPLDFIDKMDIIVVPSIREPLGNIIIEAGFCKKAVIASNVDGIAEIIENGVSGVLLEPKKEITIKYLPRNAIPMPKVVVNPLKNKLTTPKEVDSNELCIAIVALDKNKEKKEMYGEALCVTVNKKFTIENYFKNLEKVYDL